MCEAQERVGARRDGAAAARARASHARSLAVFQRFEAICSVAQQRADTGVIFKMNVMRNMHSIISGFEATARSERAQNTSTSGDGDSVGNGDGDGEDALRAWLALSIRERRRYYGSVNTKLYPYMEITQEVFDTVSTILKTSLDTDLVTSEPYRVPLSAHYVEDATAVVEKTSEQFRLVMQQFKERTLLMQPEVAMFMDALEKQTFAAREMLRKAKDARKRDQAERKQILKHLRKEQDARHAVLESLRHQEEVIRRQRFEWRHEQNELQQEWTRLNEVG